jgi:hypothetical protein
VHEGADVLELGGERRVVVGLTRERTVVLGFPGVSTGAGTVVVTSDKAVIVGGTFRNSLAFGTAMVGKLTASANGSACVIGFADDGGFRWDFGFGDAAGVQALAIDGSDSPRVAADFTGTATFITDTVAPGAGQNSLLGRITGAGGLVWDRGFAPATKMLLATSPTGETYAAGRISAPTNFGTGNLMPANASAVSSASAWRLRATTSSSRRGSDWLSAKAPEP